jgi:tetratricopeptide (TPR) repeat protein
VAEYFNRLPACHAQKFAFARKIPYSLDLDLAHRAFPMTDPPNPSPPPDESDPTIRPRAVASRHFRKPSPDPAAPTQTESTSDLGGEAGTASDDAELEQLTRQFKDLVGRKKPPAAETSGEDEARTRRRPMPRSGNVNMSVMLGEAADRAEVESTASAHASSAGRLEPAHLALPPGFAPLAWKLGAVAVVMFGLGYLLAYLMHQSPPVGEVLAAAPPPPAAWRAPTMEVLGRALVADQAGDLKLASKLVTELAAAEPNLPGLGRYLASLETRAGNFIAAENGLLALGNAGLELPQVLYLRAFNVARQRRFDDVSKLLLSSLALDPLPADPHYQMAELLRRQGKLTDAVLMARQALLRVRPGSGVSRSTIALKLRLAQIEDGQTAEVETALAEAMKFPPVAAEWIVTAAALALQRGNVVAAAEWLGKARAILPRDEFNGWVDDYFFRQHSTAPELAAFRVPDDERQRRRVTSGDFFIDP